MARGPDQQRLRAQGRTRPTGVLHTWGLTALQFGVTLDGLPLGLTAVKFWSRKAFKGRKAKRKAHNAPIEEKESVRWLENLCSSTELLGRPQRCVHVGDQESDIFDLFAVAHQWGRTF